MNQPGLLSKSWLGLMVKYLQKASRNISVSVQKSLHFPHTWLHKCIKQKKWSWQHPERRTCRYDMVLFAASSHSGDDLQGQVKVRLMERCWIFDNFWIRCQRPDKKWVKKDVVTASGPIPKRSLLPLWWRILGSRKKSLRLRVQLAWGKTSSWHNPEMQNKSKESICHMSVYRVSIC